MPTFQYRITCGAETKAVELRKSNPQGWLLEAVTATFPAVASRRPGDVMRLRLVPTGAKQSWRAILPDEPDLIIEVSEVRA
jgi:hypothetical protein